MAALVSAAILCACADGVPRAIDSGRQRDARAAAPLDGASTDARRPEAGGHEGDALSSDAAPDSATDAPPPDAPPAGALVARIEPLSTTHRFVPGAMWGGWGPHLGHLVHVGARLFFVDDGCTQGVDCDVLYNRRLEYYERTPGGWVQRFVLALPTGIQQNTGTIARGGALVSLGFDIATSQIIACAVDPTAWTGSCAPIAVAPLPASTNYIGATVAPNGWAVTWVTTVADAAGTFHWYVDFGGGWNGPRTGTIGGYNDASYIHASFGPATTPHRMVMHAQLVAGVAPSWTTASAVADIDLTTTNAATFGLTGALDGAPLLSTVDVHVDPDTGDAHVLALGTGGTVAYVFRPSGGALTAPVLFSATGGVARFLRRADGTLAIAHNPPGAGLRVLVYPPADRRAGAPLDLATARAEAFTLPAGFERLAAIYPDSAVYSGSTPDRFALVALSWDRQNEAVFVELTAP